MKEGQEVATKQAVFNTSERENTDEEGRNVGGERNTSRRLPSWFFRLVWFRVWFALIPWNRAVLSALPFWCRLTAP